MTNNGEYSHISMNKDGQREILGVCNCYYPLVAVAKEQRGDEVRDIV